MNYRRFGRSGWKVSEIGYGMWGIAGWTGSQDTQSLDSLQRAIDLGCNFFDTAWAYGDGHSEQLLGKILRANSGKTLYTATKIPPKNRRWPSRPEFTLDDCYPPDYIEEYVNKSLANIGVPTLDLIQFHTWEDAWLEDKRLRPVLEKLLTAGKVRALGISINRWQPANGVKAVRAVQNQPELNDIRWIRNAVVGAVLGHPQRKWPVLAVIEHHYRRMRGNPAPGVNQAQTQFVISLRAGRSQIEQHHVAPLAQFIQIAELEIAANIIFERTPECARNCASQPRILAYKTHMYRFLNQWSCPQVPVCAPFLG